MRTVQTFGVPVPDATIRWKPLSHNRAINTRAEVVTFILGREARDAFLRAVKDRQRRERKYKQLKLSAAERAAINRWL